MPNIKTIQDIQDFMCRIGCFNKTQLDERLHKTYLNESLEDEDWRRGANSQYDLSAGLDPKKSDHNNRIEITSSYTILYNCSPHDVIPSIIEQGPNWEYCKKHAFGKGVYTNLQEYQAVDSAWIGRQGYGDTVCKYKYNGDIMKEFLVLIPQFWGKSGDIVAQCERFKGFKEALAKQGLTPVDFQNMSRGNTSAASAQELIRMSNSIYPEHKGDNLYHVGEYAYGAHIDDVLMKYGIQGFIYYGGTDNATAIVFNTDKLQLIAYDTINRFHGSKKDIDIDWKNVPEGKGKVPYANDSRPFIHYFGDKFEGNPIYLRPFCGELLMMDKKTKKWTFIDVVKGASIISNQSNEDPRLFGDFEFEEAQNFNKFGNKEMAFVQLDKDEESRFYVDKQGNLYKNPKSEPISHINSYYPNENEPSNNAPNDESSFNMDFSFLDDDDEIDFSTLEESIKKITKKVLNEHLSLEEEVVRPLVNNMMTIISIIDRTWKSPDDLYYIKIDQRFKDFRNYNIDKGYGLNNRGAKKWKMEDPSRKDSTRRENHVGYCIVRGRTKEECKNSVLNATVHLNPWAAKIYGSKTVSSHGGMEAIIEICHKFYARAYMVVNPRSMQQTISRAREDKKAGIFKGREFVHRAGQAKSGFDGNKNWYKERPDALIDCDISDPQAWKDLSQLLKSNGCDIYNMEKSHQGMHFIVNYEQCKDLDFNSIMNSYPSFNKPGDPSILLKHDANIMAYSPAGVR